MWYADITITINITEILNYYYYYYYRCTYYYYYYYYLYVWQK